MHLTKNMRKVLEVLANSAGPLSLDQIAHRAQLDAGVAERALATLVREYVLVGEQAVIAQVSVIMYRFHSSQKAQHISQRYQLLRRGTAQTLSYDLHLDGALELILSSLQYEQEQETLNSENIAGTFLGLLGQLECSSQITPQQQALCRQTYRLLFSRKKPSAKTGDVKPAR